MDEFKDEDIEFQLCDTYDEVVKGSDVVVSAVTYAGSDFCTDDCFDEGVLVVPVHTRGFGNCDLFFDKVFMDDEGHICKFRYFDRFRYKAEVSDVVRGDSPGRENDSERLLAYNVGIALYDVYYAKKIYDLISDGF